MMYNYNIIKCLKKDHKIRTIIKVPQGDLERINKEETIFADVVKSIYLILLSIHISKRNTMAINHKGLKRLELPQWSEEINRRLMRKSSSRFIHT